MDVKLNPIFITRDEVYRTIPTSKTLILCITVIEILVIVFLLFFFFKQEITLLTSLKQKSNDDKKGVNTKHCKNNTLYINDTRAKYLDGTTMIFKDNIECVKYLNYLNA